MSRRPADAEDGGFLSRWSRRKQQARSGRPEPGEEPAFEASAALPAPADEAADEALDEDALSDEELLARYELPDPATLTASDDVAAFMRAGVPKRLRNMALRRLWRLDPVLANLDGLNDYDEDYTDAAMLAGAVKTVYQVGKGGAAHLQQAADLAAGDGSEGPQAPAEIVEAPVNPVGREADDEADDAGVESLAEPPVPETGQEVPVAAAGADPERPRRRRMVFSKPGADDLHTG